MLLRMLFVVVCIAAPVLWGAMVNWLFDFYQKRESREQSTPETIFPDYQI